MVGHHTPFSPLRPPQARIPTANSTLHHITLCNIDLHISRWRSVARAPSEGKTLHDAQRFVFAAFLVRMQGIHLIHVHRSCHSLQEPSTDSPVSPNTPITFMDPQTGPTPPNFPAPESRRRRGFRSQHPPPPPEDAPQIRCGWVGCGVQLVYNQKVISRHVNTTHKRGSQELICQWEKPGGGVCGASMQSNNLRKHTLDIHTALMIAWCEWCGEAQRKDVMSRHKKSCKGRKDGLPEQSSVCI